MICYTLLKNIPTYLKCHVENEEEHSMLRNFRCLWFHLYLLKLEPEIQDLIMVFFQHSQIFIDYQENIKSTNLTAKEIICVLQINYLHYIP